MTAWGRTGRVTLGPSDFVEDSRVLVDGVRAGLIGSTRDHWIAVAAVRGMMASKPLPSRDAAVMWVLRRTAPKVWRAERPVVYRVTWEHDTDPERPWHVWPTDPRWAGAPIPFSRAGTPIESADRWARGEYEDARGAS